MGTDTDDSFSDFDDDEIVKLYQDQGPSAINKTVTKTVTTRHVPIQYDLQNNPVTASNTATTTAAGSDQQPQTYYEEIRSKVTFGPTHHELIDSKLTNYLYPTNFEVRDYQYNIVHRALLRNTLCAIPTGMGKTFIASTVMLNFYRWSRRGKVIFMAPTRPLVAQQIQACLGVAGIPSRDAAILLDKSRKNRIEIWKEKRVFFSTPQVVENDLKRGALDPRDIICLVIDEAHRALGSYAYTNVVKFVDRFNTSYRILALTATPGATLENVQEVVKNLDISTIEIRTEDSADVVKYMKRREKDSIEVRLLPKIEDIIEQLGIAVTPALQQAVELGIYEQCEPSQINSFKAIQQSQKLLANPSIPENLKWRNYFILQLLNQVGQMLRRIKIYGIRAFYSYFKNKYAEFTTKYGMGKSTNKIAAGFYYNPVLKTLISECEQDLKDPNFISHGKLECIRDELESFFLGDNMRQSRVIIFTELRESALEIVKWIDAMGNPTIRPHIFIGQAKGKEGFDEASFIRKNKPKGRTKLDKLKRMEEDRLFEEQRQREKEAERLERGQRRTASSEEAQINGMTQKQQKDILRRFKKGEFNVLVCTSIGEEGLDIGEVDCIICYDTTSSPIKNIQRMGRTGRKRDGRVLLLFSGNEARKFEQAMEDYAKLQKMIMQNLIEYTKSDRIIPQGINPECKKVLIKPEEEDEIVNMIDDADELINYATQRTLMKNPKPPKTALQHLLSGNDKSGSGNRSKHGDIIDSLTRSKRKKLESGGRQLGNVDAIDKETPKKVFFMPLNVETGIVSASTLVNKYTTDGNGDPHLEHIKGAWKTKNDGDTSILELIDNDSLSSASSDMSDIDDILLLNLPRKQKACGAVDNQRKRASSVEGNETDEIEQLATEMPKKKRKQGTEELVRIEEEHDNGIDTSKNESNNNGISDDEEDTPLSFLRPTPGQLPSPPLLSSLVYLDDSLNESTPSVWSVNNLPKGAPQIPPRREAQSPATTISHTTDTALDNKLFQLEKHSPGTTESCPSNTQTEIVIPQVRGDSAATTISRASTTSIASSNSIDTIAALETIPLNNLQTRFVGKTTYTNREGLLTESEKQYFKEHYSPNARVSMELTPNFANANCLKTIGVPHSRYNEEIIALFRDLQTDSKERIIDMNRTRCIALSLQNNSNKRQNQDQKKSQDGDKNQPQRPQLKTEPKQSPNVVPSSATNQTREWHGSQRLESPVPVPILGTVNEETLDGILGSDSDFE